MLWFTRFPTDRIEKFKFVDRELKKARGSNPLETIFPSFFDVLSRPFSEQTKCGDSVTNSMIQKDPSDSLGTISTMLTRWDEDVLKDVETTMSRVNGTLVGNLAVIASLCTNENVKKQALAHLARITTFYENLIDSQFDNIYWFRSRLITVVIVAVLAAVLCYC